MKIATSTPGPSAMSNKVFRDIVQGDHFNFPNGWIIVVHEVRQGQVRALRLLDRRNRAVRPLTGLAGVYRQVGAYPVAPNKGEVLVFVRPQ